MKNKLLIATIFLFPFLAIKAFANVGLNLNLVTRDDGIVGVMSPNISSSAYYFQQKTIIISGDSSTIIVNGEFNSNTNTSKIYKVSNDATSIIMPDFAVGNWNVLGLSNDGATMAVNKHVGVIDEGYVYSNGVLQPLTGMVVNAISGDGKTIVGYYDNIAKKAVFSAGAWTVSSIGTPPTSLGFSGVTKSLAKDVSDDGNIIVGILVRTTGTIAAFQKEGNAVPTTYSVFGAPFTSPSAISGDGRVVVGAYGDPASGVNTMQGFKRQDNITSDIGSLGGGRTEPFDISYDGSVVVGGSVDADGKQRAFKYINSKDGNGVDNSIMSNLGTLGGNNSVAYSVSSDGKIIVGSSEIAPGSNVTHAFATLTISSKNLVDLTNTAQSLAINASNLDSITNFAATNMNFALDQDMLLFGKNNVGVSIGGRYTSVKTFNKGQENPNNFASVLKAGYRFNRHFKIGLYVDQSLTDSMPNNFQVKDNSPLVGIFSTISEHSNDIGFSLRLSIVQGKSDITATRSTLTNTEAGQGSTALKSKGMMAELGYGLKYKNYLVKPYIAIRDSKVTRAAYGENSGADFPISFSNFERKSRTAIAGARFATNIRTDLSIKFGAGVERDLSASISNYSGNIFFLGGFDIEAPKIRKNRTFANVGIYYDLKKSQQIGFDLTYRQQALNNAIATTGYLQYNIGF